MWIDFSSRTVEFQLSKCRENLPPLFFSLSIRLTSLLSSPFSFLSTEFLCFFFGSSLSHFLLIFLFSLFSFFFSLLFFSPLFSSIFSFLSLLLIILNRIIQKWGKLSPTFLHCHLPTPCFSSLFSLFSFHVLSYT